MSSFGLGKIILLGEHAVVYGYPALAAALDRGVTIDAVPTPAEIDHALTKLESLARERGVAIGTASALPISIDRIGAWIKTLDAHGVMLVPLTTAMLKSKSS